MNLMDLIMGNGNTMPQGSSLTGTQDPSINSAGINTNPMIQSLLQGLGQQQSQSNFFPQQDSQQPYTPPVKKQSTGIMGLIDMFL